MHFPLNPLKQSPLLGLFSCQIVYGTFIFQAVTLNAVFRY